MIRRGIGSVPLRETQGHQRRHTDRLPLTNVRDTYIIKWPHAVSLYGERRRLKHKICRSEVP